MPVLSTNDLNPPHRPCPRTAVSLTPWPTAPPCDSGSPGPAPAARLKFSPHGIHPHARDTPSPESGRDSTLAPNPTQPLMRGPARIRDPRAVTRVAVPRVRPAASVAAPVRLQIPDLSSFSGSFPGTHNTTSEILKTPSTAAAPLLPLSVRSTRVGRVPLEGLGFFRPRRWRRGSRRRAAGARSRSR